MKFLYLSLLLLVCNACRAQQSPVFNDDPMQHLPLGTELSQYRLREPTGLTNPSPRVEPLNWWTDMVDPRLEILIYDRNVAENDAVTVDYPGVVVEYVRRLANPNYLFVGLYISPGTSPGSFQLRLASRGRATKNIPYELQAHPRKEWTGRSSLSPADLIYLIMPDRFANGDPGNDRVAGSTDTLVNRQKFLFRHGGDLQGIIDKLDYLADLGVTALWLNPVLENDQPYQSYHGYAVTDHYRIDPRLGTNALYRELVDQAHARGIKVVMDVIFNHVGDQHYQIQDLPSADWIHQWPEYTQTTYRATTLLDPNASEYDRRLMTDGWFDKHMPDLNQHQAHLASYLIQNSIWWTLFSGQDAFRIDTYAYPDADFMAEWNRRLREEIPHLGIFGETWVHGPAVQAWFTGGQAINQRLDSHLPGVTDFQLYYAINEAMSKDPGWTDGVLRIYYTLAQDYLYEHPGQNVTFLDNHDLARLYTVYDGDLVKVKSSLALLLTLRGIPMIYYGTELAFAGAGGAFGEGGRVDFPGGFPGDARNLFTAADRNATEQEVFTFVKNLANYRKQSAALTTGQLTQFLPRDGVYVFFRHAGDETVMVVFNGNATERKLTDLSPYTQMLSGFQRGEDLTRGSEATNLAGLTLAGKETRVLRLLRK
ncbi:glycoside hydrolase family 13 protein [Neolewinella lacunae]|uniref:Glycoside hydrolase family 13 protein n=1 Tax=Neolewinella lacunae TaxID=1517758 RepID=A0A923PGG1_9BACT|nr:glycoside hydrolase family 13 protein [Neolewinella lacunae]MBC6992819.1 glycoside hydrolase family 13 protein [Neolewinella lacunae]MDN3636092.1 glycoside hydrolase family 13 protein [Neolewinella lacunae]